ncbi:MAG: c-type cytochrome [Thermoanaerobaculia bacterium]
MAAFAFFSIVSGSALALERSPVELYDELCAACHTVGEGESGGPDLFPSTSWPRAELRAAVERMQENTGPMTPEQIDAIVDLLANPDVKSLLAGEPPATPHPATSKPAPASPPPPQGSPDRGRRLFFGDEPLAKGGSPCHACHAVNARGGTLARDLTGSHARLGARALLAATENAPFPMMKAAYAGRPLTPDETVDIVAFLREAPTQPAQAAERGVILGGAAGGLILIALSAGSAARARRAGTRSRMVRDSRRR